jgi:2-iminobutanoate/2-iminopropanoate deaminase
MPSGRSSPKTRGGSSPCL